jgi:hypothetical protein
LLKTQQLHPEEVGETNRLEGCLTGIAAIVRKSPWEERERAATPVSPRIPVFYFHDHRNDVALRPETRTQERVRWR